MSDAKLHTDFTLPTNIVSKLDVSRLVNEAERVDQTLTSAAIRTKTGAAEAGAMPAMSEQLSSFLQQNELTLDDAKVRGNLIKELRKLKDTVRIIHMTFAVPADGESLQELAAWLRESIHPQAVVDVGLQPGLVGGVYLRTPNHVHDFSLKGKLQGGHQLLLTELEAARGAE